MKRATTNVEAVSVRYATRKTDQNLKRVTVEAVDLATLKASYATSIASVDPEALFKDFKTALEAAIVANDLNKVLQLYDDKGLLPFAAKTLGLNDAKELMEKVTRLLGDEKRGKGLRDALKAVLPEITV